MRFCSIRRVLPYGSAPDAALRMMSQFRFIEDLLVLSLSLSVLRARAEAIDMLERTVAKMRSRSSRVSETVRHATATRVTCDDSALVLPQPGSCRHTRCELCADSATQGERHG